MWVSVQELPKKEYYSVIILKAALNLQLSVVEERDNHEMSIFLALVFILMKWGVNKSMSLPLTGEVAYYGATSTFQGTLPR